MSETWVINSSDNTFATFNQTISFSSNGSKFTSISMTVSGEPPTVTYTLSYGSTPVAMGNALTGFDWGSDNYKTLVFDSAVDLTTDFGIWLNVNAVKQYSQLSIDLTTLSGWSSLSSGTYDVYVKSKGKDVPSDASESVSVEKASSGYTITINGSKIRNMGQSAVNGYIKFDSASASLTDYDYYANRNGVYDSNGNLVSTPFTVNASSWVMINYGIYFDSTSSWSSGFSGTFTSNETIYIGYREEA